jgi:hypothetical protein
LASRALRVRLTTFFQNLDPSHTWLRDQAAGFNGKKCLMPQGTVKWFNALRLHPAG